MFTYDTIPFKTYFKIVETGDLKLLGDADEADLIKIFDDISNQRQKATEGHGDSGRTKQLDVYCQMEALSSKYKFIKYAVHCLRHVKDDELIELLRDKGYKITDDLQSSLDYIEKTSEGLLIKIESIKNRLPKKKEIEEKEPPLDEVILSYCALLEMGFVDTNSVTLSQYDSIITLGNRKMDALNKINNGGK